MYYKLLLIKHASFIIKTIKLSYQNSWSKTFENKNKVYLSKVLFLIV